MGRGFRLRGFVRMKQRKERRGSLRRGFTEMWAAARRSLPLVMSWCAMVRREERNEMRGV